MWFHFHLHKALPLVFPLCFNFVFILFNFSSHFWHWHKLITKYVQEVANYEVYKKLDVYILGKADNTATTHILKEAEFLGLISHLCPAWGLNETGGGSLFG